MKRDLPNPSILVRLRDRYFSNQANTADSEWISSHWEYESQFLEVEEDIHGPRPVSGAVWGCKWGGRLSNFLARANILSHLAFLPQKKRILQLSSQASKICDRMVIDPTYTVFRQVCSVELLQRHLEPRSSGGRLRLLVIGDGIGMISSVFKAAFPKSTIAMVDIGKTLMYQAYYVQRAYPDCVHEMADPAVGFAEADFIYCPTEDLDELDDIQFDVAVNIASMQEMNEKRVERYFTFLRQHFNESGMFYCCNRVHKILVGGEVSELYNYPWSKNDKFLVDEPCGWYRHYISRRRSQTGPRFLGIRVPLFNHFDGAVSHRLAVLERNPRHREN